MFSDAKRLIFAHPQCFSRASNAKGPAPGPFSGRASAPACPDITVEAPTSSTISALPGRLLGPFPHPALLDRLSVYCSAFFDARHCWGLRFPSYWTHRWMLEGERENFPLDQPATPLKWPRLHPERSIVSPEISLPTPIPLGYEHLHPRYKIWRPPCRFFH